MARVFVGNLDPRVTETELEDEFRIYGVVKSVWVARRPPGYAFIEFDNRRDALDAISSLDGKNEWRVELSHNSKDGGGGGSRGGRGGGGGGGGGGGDALKCYQCGEAGHFARECSSRGGPPGRGSGRRSPSPRRRRSPSYGHSPRGRKSPVRRSVSPYRGRKSPVRRSVSPYRGRKSPVRRSVSPYRGRRSPVRRSVSPYRGRSRSPPYRRALRRDSPYANGRSSPYRRARRASPFANGD